MTKKVWFSFFTNVVPADYEQWLESLALEGWNVDKIEQFDSFCMTFHKTESKKYRYVFDLNAFPKEDYRNTYEQFGWEYVGAMASCFIWRKEYTDVRPESFTDTESLIKRNKRVRNAVILCFVMCLTAILALLSGIVVCALTDKAEKILSLSIETGLIAFFGVYLYWVIKKIQDNITR